MDKHSKLAAMRRRIAMRKQTPGQAHAQHCTDIGALLDLIGQEVNHHAEYARDEGLNWGHVGDVAALRRALIEALAQLSQQGEAFIEQHLAELSEG